MINIKLSGKSIEKTTKIYHTGYEDCLPNYSFGPFIRDHYLIHFVIKGEGIFKLNQKTYHIKKNEAFIILPGQLTYYESSSEKPWSYYWIGCHGDDIKDMIDTTGFNQSPVIKFKSNDVLYSMLAKLQDLDTMFPAHRYKQTAYLYEIFARLAELNTTSDATHSKAWYAEQAVLFMQKNYALGITIQDVSDYLKLNRSYFSRLFKSIYGISAQNYLIGYRMFKAKYLLVKSQLLISEVAYSVGYEDAYTFTKAFKKSVGQNPTDYRSHHKI